MACIASSCARASTHGDGRGLGAGEQPRRHGAGGAGPQRGQVLRVHDRVQRAVGHAVEGDHVPHALAGTQVHRFEAHPARAFEHRRPDAQPALARLHVQALGLGDLALALLAEGALHGGYRVGHRHRGVHVVVSQQQYHVISRATPRLAQRSA
jgi:hypothetical protein